MQPHPLAKVFLGKIDYTFGLIWLNLGEILAEVIRFGQYWGEIWANMIRFGQNQNLASPKTFDLLYGYAFKIGLLAFKFIYRTISFFRRPVIVIFCPQIQCEKCETILKL